MYNNDNHLNHGSSISHIALTYHMTTGPATNQDHIQSAIHLAHTWSTFCSGHIIPPEMVVTHGTVCGYSLESPQGNTDEYPQHNWAASWQNQQNGLCAQSDQSSLYAQWVAKDPSFLHADSEDSDHTGRMPRLIRVFAGRTCHFVGFVMRRHNYVFMKNSVNQSNTFLIL